MLEKSTSVKIHQIRKHHKLRDILRHKSKTIKLQPPQFVNFGRFHLRKPQFRKNQEWY